MSCSPSSPRDRACRAALARLDGPRAHVSRQPRPRTARGVLLRALGIGRVEEHAGLRRGATSPSRCRCATNPHATPAEARGKHRGTRGDARGGRGFTTATIAKCGSCSGRARCPPPCVKVRDLPMDACPALPGAGSSDGCPALRCRGAVQIPPRQRSRHTTRADPRTRPPPARDLRVMRLGVRVEQRRSSGSRATSHRCRVQVRLIDGPIAPISHGVGLSRRARQKFARNRDASLTVSVRGGGEGARGHARAEERLDVVRDVAERLPHGDAARLLPPNHRKGRGARRRSREASSAGSMAGAAMTSPGAAMAQARCPRCRAGPPLPSVVVHCPRRRPRSHAPRSGARGRSFPTGRGRG